MKWQRWVWVVIACASACGHDTESETAAACVQVCRCEESPLPALQQQCVATCEAEPILTSDQCLDCVLESAQSCPKVDACMNECGEMTGGGDDSI